MRWITRLTLALISLILISPVAAQEQGGAIAWSKDLPTAMEAAKKAERLLMVCINAKSVDGEMEEPAAKGLRDVVYKDKRVVERSRDFVCVFLTAKGSSKEYDVLRKLGIDGDITSPQHVFVSADGTRIVHRRAYWVFGKGERAVEVLLEMMTKAEAAAKIMPAPEPEPEGDGPPKSDSERATWIAGLIEQVADLDKRYAAARQLVAADNDGDCTGPLIALLPEYKKDKSALRAIVRALGRDGLEAAALPIADLLKHKEDTVRANAAVSLEYIGSHDKKVVAALKRLADKEKDAAIANHAFRALGRCGTDDSKIRTFLLKKATSGKSEYATYGPCIALAYFEEDEKAMRGVEKMLKQIGVPGGRSGTNVVKRGLVSWTLASIGDVDSGDFVREELIAGLEHVTAFWVEGLRGFWDLVAKVCEGERESLPAVVAGVGGFVRFAKGANMERYGGEEAHLMDEARKNRDATDFKPKGEDILNVDDE